MLEYISSIISFYKVLTEGIKSLKLKGRSKDKISVQRKIILIQITLEMIIETAEDILNSISLELQNTDDAENKPLDDTKKLVYQQAKNIDQLILILNDETSQKLLKLFVENILMRGYN